MKYVKLFEQFINEIVDLVHVYDKNGELFGTGELVKTKGKKSLIRWDGSNEEWIDSNLVKMVESTVNEGWDTYGNSGNFSIGNKKVAWQIRYLFDRDSSNAQIMVDTAQFAEAMGLDGTELVSDYSENMAIAFIKPWNDKKNWRELSPEDFDITEPSKKYKNAADFIKWVKPFNSELEDDLQYY